MSVVKPLPMPMRYKTSCPGCGTKISRRSLFCEPRIYHTCLGCSSRLSLGAAGWIFIFGVNGIQVLWFLLAHRHVIAVWLAMLLVLLTAGLAFWLAPYVIPAQLKTGGKKHARP